MENVRKAWIRAARWILISTVLFLILKALHHYSGEVKNQVSHIRLSVLVAGYILCVLTRVQSAAGWVMILRGMRQHMPLIHGMRLWLTSWSMRWLPGGIWSYASLVYQASRNGVPPAVASASLPLELFLTLGAWMLAAWGGILASGRSVDWRAPLTPQVIAFCVGGIFIGVAAVFISLRAFPQSRIRGKVNRLISELQALRAIRLRWPVLAGVLVFYTAIACLNGLGFFVVIRSISDAAVDPVAVIGINACGWLFGMLAVAVPGGIGVREAGAAMLLGTLIPLPAAIASSVLWRVVMILDELTCLAACLVTTPAGSLGSPPVTPANAQVPTDVNTYETDQK